MTPAVALPAGQPALVLKAGRDKSVRQRHPWIFSGAIERLAGEPAAGDTVTVVDAAGEPLALAAWSPASQISARVWTWDVRAAVDAAFMRSRVQAAAAARAPLLDAAHTGARLVHGESDGLPGVVADRYGEVVVLQCASAGAERWRDALAAALAELPGVTCVYERSDADVRALEGLAPRSGALVGALPAELVVTEDGLRYAVDAVAGQKTGFYLDQRDNRRLVRDLAAGCRVLNAFCYSGGFTLAALAGDAQSVLSIDSSAEALAQGARNLALNPALPAARNEWAHADAFADLRRLRNEAAVFDLIVLDPPKFAPTAAHAERAARAYKDINLLALKLLAPGGLLATFSCSGGVSLDLFQKIVAGAAVDAQANAQIVRRLTAGADHPVALNFPESEYLKGLLIRKA
ncbi:MAG: class I SAM-dependent rRNA methyltransferase [Burkholderiales bacterium]